MSGLDGAGRAGLRSPYSRFRPSRSVTGRPRPPLSHTAGHSKAICRKREDVIARSSLMIGFHRNAVCCAGPAK